MTSKSLKILDLSEITSYCFSVWFGLCHLSPCETLHSNYCHEAGCHFEIEHFMVPLNYSL